MIDARREWKDLARGPLDHLCGGPPVLGRVLEQLVFEHLPELTLPSILFRQVFCALHKEFGHPMREVDHLVRR